MREFLGDFLLAFVPLFVAVDPMGIMPMYLGLTEGMSPRQRRVAVLESIITALTIAVGFIFAGRAIFDLMGVTIYDFRVAGGVLLFLLATIDLVSGQKAARHVGSVGPVPLGTPLIAGPAVLTTSLMLAGVYGLAATLAAVVINILIVAAVLLAADRIVRLTGEAVSRALSKVASLILAAIAVMLIRTGLAQILSSPAQ